MRDWTTAIPPESAQSMLGLDASGGIPDSRSRVAKDRGDGRLPASPAITTGFARSSQPARPPASRPAERASEGASAGTLFVRDA